MNKFKNETTRDPQFRKMLSMAKEYFDVNSLQKCEYHQCLVLCTQQDEVKLYSLNCDSVEELVHQSCLILTKEKITTIQKIVCMWEGGGVDVPAYQFIKKLCALNIENKKAEILLRTASNVYNAKRIVDIIG